MTIRFRIISILLLIILISSCSTGKKTMKPEDKNTKPEEKSSQEDRSSKYMVASWYGRQFHGKPTASGEIFDMNAPTAAHKKLPFGTKLLVINPDNEKSTTVTITDRGPYIWGRELDLSYKAASDIGMIGAGVATVKVVFLGTDHKYDNYITEKIEVGTAMVDPKDISSPLTVQIGTFKDNLNAIRMKIAVKERYESTEIFEDTVDGKKYFKVRVGKFNSKKQAQLLADNLSDEGYETIILRYK